MTLESRSKLYFQMINALFCHLRFKIFEHKNIIRKRYVILRKNVGAVQEACNKNDKVVTCGNPLSDLLPTH